MTIFINSLKCHRLGCDRVLNWESNTNDKDSLNRFAKSRGWALNGNVGAWACPEHAPQIYHHRSLCAAYVNGCKSVLVWSDNMFELDENVMLANSWWLDHGKWVCSAHPKTKEKKMDSNTPDYLPMATGEDEALALQLKGLKIVRHYVQQKLDKSDPEAKFQVFPVWFSKTLQNWKMLASTTLNDQMYYEITHNGDLGETYVDAYKKWENVKYLDGWDETGV